jgi:acyl-CoA reductase-like NAD-dependent aldehyde dehydrogenase
VRFTRQGQSCTAASRIYVHEDIFEEFVTKMKQKIDALKMGDPQSEETDIGTVITAVSASLLGNIFLPV